MENNKFVMIDENGQEREYDVLFTFESEETNKNYIVYDGRITFELGECEDLQNKIYRGLAACEQLNEGSSGIRGRLDVSGGKQSYFTAEEGYKMCKVNYLTKSRFYKS